MKKKLKRPVKPVKLKPENIRFGQMFQKLIDEKDVSIRAVAKEFDMQPTYVMKIIQGKVSPSEKFILKVSEMLDEHPEVLFSVAGRVTSRLASAIAKHPKALSDLIFQLENAPENAILRVIREVREGEW